MAATPVTPVALPTLASLQLVLIAVSNGIRDANEITVRHTQEMTSLREEVQSLRKEITNTAGTTGDPGREADPLVRQEFVEIA